MVSQIAVSTITKEYTIYLQLQCILLAAINSVRSLPIQHISMDGCWSTANGRRGEDRDPACMLLGESLATAGPKGQAAELDI